MYMCQYALISHEVARSGPAAESERTASRGHVTLEITTGAFPEIKDDKYSMHVRFVFRACMTRTCTVRAVVKRCLHLRLDSISARIPIWT